MYGWISLALCLLSMLVFVLVKIKLDGKNALIAKIFASAIFVVAGIVALITSKTHPVYSYIIFAGLVCGLMGDIILGLFELNNAKFKKPVYLNMGMLSFGLGHICYITGISFHSVTEIDSVLVPLILACAIGVVIALLIFVNARALSLNFGEYKYTSLTYSSVLCSAFVYSLFTTVLTKFLWPTFIALTFFLISDLILSYMYFGEKNVMKVDVANKVTYYTAQIMFVAYLFFFI